MQATGGPQDPELLACEKVMSTNSETVGYLDPPTPEDDGDNDDDGGHRPLRAAILTEVTSSPDK